MGLSDTLWLLLLAVLLFAMVSIAWSTFRLGISPMPSSPKVRALVLSLVPEDFQGTLYELGAGWGSLAFPLADRCPKARVVAFELSLLPFAFCWLRQRLKPRPNLELRREDFFQASFSEAAIVVCYLYRGGMARLGPKLSRELPPNAQILSHTFALHGWRPRETHVVPDLYRTPVYVYGRESAPPGGA